jgi:hypothetical protein
MISCKLRHLEARCRERGTTLDAVRACIVSEDGDTLTVDETHAAYPKAKPGPTPLQPPTLLQKAANFAAAAAQHVAAGAPMASEAEVQRRHDICTACPHFDGRACGLCGCPVARERKWLSKLSWADQKCPDDPPRWGPVEG